ncbi:hypothetical protein Aph02nite_32730 [Actinoplanes philippinensis]|nr:hypothetical protein Aph02nite_32730 [Actinoplanes philippinensis]
MPPRVVASEARRPALIGAVTARMVDAGAALTVDLRIAARILTRIFEVKAAAVSLVRCDAVRILGSHGLPCPRETARSTPRLRSPCAQVVIAGRPLVIEDLPAWHAGSDGPAARADGMTAYVGVPLRVQGDTVGTVCLLDDRRIGQAIALLPCLDRLGREIALMIATGKTFDDDFYVAAAEASRTRTRYRD